MNDQRQLFNNILDLKHQIQNIAGYVQNDFQMLKKEHNVTTQEITESVKNMHHEYDNLISKLNQFRLESEKLMLSME